jgi:hypothetical protein
VLCFHLRRILLSSPSLQPKVEGILEGAIRARGVPLSRDRREGRSCAGCSVAHAESTETEQPELDSGVAPDDATPTFGREGCAGDAAG